MKRFWMMVLLVISLGSFLAGCSKGTKVHIEEERRTEETRPVIVGD